MKWDMNINLREPSTKRGIVMLITGGMVVYQTFWGSGQIDIDSLLARVDWWLGIGLTIVGMLGFLPDRDPEKRTRETDSQKQEPSPDASLPVIELVGKPMASGEIQPTSFYGFDDSDHPRRRVSDQLRDTLPSIPRFKNPASPHSGSVGWNDDN